jgi:hypothetical protein
LLEEDIVLLESHGSHSVADIVEEAESSVFETRGFLKLLNRFQSLQMSNI